MPLKQTALESLALILLMAAVNAQADYSIYMDLFVATDGSVLLYGDTDIEGPSIELGSDSFPIEGGHFSNSTDLMTGKEADLWTLSLMLPPGVRDGLITVYLPSGTMITETTPPGLIFSERGDLVVAFYDLNSTDVTVKYRLGSSTSLDWEAYLVPALLVVAVILLVVGGIRLIMPRLAHSEPAPRKTAFDENRWDAIAPTLTERERMVLESIMKEGGRVSQRKLRHICDLPKSTLSRVTDELQRKGLIRKIPVGQTNEIRLDDRLLE